MNAASPNNCFYHRGAVHCVRAVQPIQYVNFLHQLTLYNTTSAFEALWKRSFENIVEKGENAGNQYFLLLTLYQTIKF